jgi:hypothetical protein
MCIGIIEDSIRVVSQSQSIGLIGGYGLLSNGQAAHNGAYKSMRKSPNSYDRYSYAKGDTVGVMYREGKLSFYVNRELAGVAFDSIDTGKDYFPAVSISKSGIKLISFREDEIDPLFEEIDAYPDLEDNPKDKPMQIQIEQPKSHEVPKKSALHSSEPYHTIPNEVPVNPAMYSPKFPIPIN